MGQGGIRFDDLASPEASQDISACWQLCTVHYIQTLLVCSLCSNRSLFFFVFFFIPNSFVLIIQPCERLPPVVELRQAAATASI